MPILHQKLVLENDVIASSPAAEVAIRKKEKKSRVFLRPD